MYTKGQTDMHKTVARYSVHFIITDVDGHGFAEV